MINRRSPCCSSLRSGSNALASSALMATPTGYASPGGPWRTAHTRKKSLAPSPAWSCLPGWSGRFATAAGCGCAIPLKWWMNSGGNEAMTAVFVPGPCS